ncbi:SRPBCC family protein [Anaeromyxobacter oryzisoli]|uniref:SRPBCC family protein n=1 Tax=Anaeromyxobacter oryzisoli TaxID=2925408 RepID=UPI001F55C3A0|nr:SRPBCC family protein [Anaeromyxobacter sp. SG63]
MERIEKSVLIEAPVTRIFEYMTDPTNLLEIWPSLVAVEHAEIKADGSHAFDWTYKMAGLHFHGHARTLDVERDWRRVVRNDAGIPSTLTWRYEAREHGTEVMLLVDYEIPIPVLGRLAAPFLRRANEREAEIVLENLKERMEIVETTGLGESTREGAPTPPPP